MIRLFASLEIEILMNTEEQHWRLFSDVGICVSVTEVTTTVTVLTSKLVFFVCVCVCVCVSARDISVVTSSHTYLQADCLDIRFSEDNIGQISHLLK